LAEWPQLLWTLAVGLVLAVVVRNGVREGVSAQDLEGLAVFLGVGTLVALYVRAQERRVARLRRAREAAWARIEAHACLAPFPRPIPWEGWEGWKVLKVRRDLDDVGLGSPPNPADYDPLPVLRGAVQRGAEGERVTDCPACQQLITLSRENPRLSLHRLDALVRRQIVLGRCPPHSSWRDK